MISIRWVGPTQQRRQPRVQQGMRAFLDFEASSLGDESYPIEVGWVFEDGASESHLIRPASGWTDWDVLAEAIHGITRARLQAEGEPHAAVARRVLEVLGPHMVYASAPSWDGKWLSVLLRGAGLPRHALRLQDSEQALLEAASEGLDVGLPDDEQQAAAAALLVQARENLSKYAVRHRALEDAAQERRLWLEVRRLAASGVRAPMG